MVLLRELLTVFHGNELSIGIVLATWMLTVGVGSGIGARICRHARDAQRITTWTASGVLILLPTTIVAIRLSSRLLNVVPGTHPALEEIALLSVPILAPVCILLGIHFVLLSRLWRELIDTHDINRRNDCARSSSAGASGTYGFEAFGNAVGGLLFSLLLVYLLNPLQTAVLAGALMCLAARWARTKDEEHIRKRHAFVRVALLPACIIGMLVLVPFDRYLHTVRWRQVAPGQTLLETVQSRYGTISVLRGNKQFSFFQSGVLSFSTAEGESKDVEFEEQDAALFAHLAMVQSRNPPRRVLLIGGGMRGVLREMLRHPVEVIDYLELDPALISVAKRYLPESTKNALRDTRVNLKITDGRIYLKNTEKMYDLIAVDVPDPATAVMNRFYTREFFRDAGDRLAHGGVIMITLGHAGDLRGREAANRNATIYHTLGSEFSNVLAMGHGGNIMVASQAKGQICVDLPELISRYRDRGIASGSFSVSMFHTLIDDLRIRRLNWLLHHHGRYPDAHRSPPDAGPVFPPPLDAQTADDVDLPAVNARFFINEDFRPIGYVHNLMLWNLHTRSRRAPVLDGLLKFKTWWVLPPIILILVVSMALRMFGARLSNSHQMRFSLLMAAFTTGFSSMALQIALIFAFQSIYGFVYSMIGLILALFMTGLGLGTLLTERCIHYKNRPHRLALLQFLIALLGIIVAVALPLAARVRTPAAAFALFSLLSFMAGFLNGVDFPLATSCFMGIGHRAENATATVYGVELIGACLGATITGTMIAPVFGLVACGLLAGVLNTTAGVVLLIAIYQPSFRA